MPAVDRTGCSLLDQRWGMFVIKIKLGMLVPGSPRSAVDYIMGLVDQAERAARSTLQQLSSPVLHTLGLVPALGWLAEEMQRTHGLAVHFEGEGEPRPLLDGVETILFRSARELLINVARHARVGEAILCCLSGESALVLVVRDEGCGFDAAHFLDALPGEFHFGLRSIYERMANIGGEMGIDSCPGKGTTITLAIPYCVAGKECPPS